MKQNLLPKHKSDFIKAYDELFKARFDGLNLSSINTTADAVPANFLKHLAASFGINTTGFSDEQARVMIKNGFMIHYQAGTAKALKTALKAFYENSKILEWFEYEGEPYHFKLELDSQSEPISDDGFLKANTLINEHKNVRSVCDGISASMISKGNICFAMTNHAIKDINILPKNEIVNLNLANSLRMAVIINERIDV